MTLLQTTVKVLIISIPEDYFITMLILKILGKSSYWTKEHWQENLINILKKSVIPIVVLLNMINFIFKNNSNHLLTIMFESIVAITMTAFTITSLIELKDKKHFLKILLASLLGFIIFLSSEFIMKQLIIYGLNISANTFKESLFLRFALIMPKRLTEYGFIVYVFLKKNNPKQITLKNQITTIYRNTKLRVLAVLFIVIDAIILVTISNYFYISDSLVGYSFKLQLFIFIGSLSFLIISILVILLKTVHIYNIETEKNFV